MSVPAGHLALQRRMASCRSISCISVATGKVRSDMLFASAREVALPGQYVMDPRAQFVNLAQ
eukprot:2318603-Prymnesium_polylepis.1